MCAGVSISIVSLDVLLLKGLASCGGRVLKGLEGPAVGSVASSVEPGGGLVGLGWSEEVVSKGGAAGLGGALEG